MPVTPILLAGLAVFMAAALLVALVAGFHRFAPSHLVRERHDLALAAILVLPLVFVLALRAAPIPPPEMTNPADPAAATVLSGTGPDMVEVERQDAALDEAAAEASVPKSGFLATAMASGLAALRFALPVIWVMGSLAFALRLLRDFLALQQLRTRSARLPCPPGFRLSATLPMAESDAVSTPLLAGYWRPQILLPRGFRFDEAARPVLEHEIAHARRGDAWTVLVLRCLEVLFWWVLPLRPLMTRLEAARESLCDRDAARITQAPRALALALLDAAEARTRTPSLALAATPTRSSLADRVGCLTAPDTLERKDTPMRFSLLLPGLAVTALVFTPQFGEARALEGHAVATATIAASAPARRLDDSFDLDAHLFQAARRGQLNRVRGLLADGANPDVRFSGDGTALIAAMRSGSFETAEALLAAGADPDLGVEGDGSPMIAAAARGRDDLVQLLLSNGADVETAFSGDGNALIAAAMHGRLETVDLLLAAGANPDSYVLGDETPMVGAAQQGHLDVIQRLAAAGADLSLTVLAHSRDGQDIYRSPLSEARRIGHTDIVNWLESRGAEHREPTR